MVKKHVKVIFVKVQKNLTSISVTDESQSAGNVTSGGTNNFSGSNSQIMTEIEKVLNELANY